MLDATKYKGTDTCAYEQAKQLQVEAHRYYMIAIGLLDNTIPIVTKSKSRSKKRKIPAAGAVGRRTNPTRAVRKPLATKERGVKDPALKKTRADLGEVTPHI